MLLALLIAATQAADAPPRFNLASYLEIADAYRGADRDSALRQIREWPLPEIRSAVARVQSPGQKLRASTKAPDTLAIATVEGAVLMHAEAGLLALRAPSTDEAEVHLRAAMALLSWSRQAAADLRARIVKLLAATNPALVQGKPGVPADYDVRPRIDRGLLSLALAAGALEAGLPATASPFAADARRASPLDPDVQFVFGCVAEAQAELAPPATRDSVVTAQRDEAAKAFAQALVLDAGVISETHGLTPPTTRAREARLRLGRVSLAQGWLPEAHEALASVEKSGDTRQRYLALLLLGRLAGREGHPHEAVASYRRALELWPESQSAALALAHATERSSGPEPARLLVAKALELPTRADSPADPWRSYLFGLPRLATALFERVRTTALD